jgi:uncharacterized protein
MRVQQSPLYPVTAKKLTGSLDEVQVAAIRDRVQQLRDLDKRREAILKSLTDMGKLTPELEAN